MDMKRIVRLCMSCLLAGALMLPAATFSKADESGGKLPMLSGMFVAPELTSGSDACNQDDWNAIMTQMKGVGIETIVVQYAVQYYNDTVKTYYYNPTFETPAAPDNGGYRNQIPFMLEAAKANGMKIYLGLHIAESAWFSAMPAGFSDLNAKGESTFLVSSAAYSKDVFDDLWKQFGSEYGDVIAGWYLPFEFNNDAVKNENGSLPRLIKNFYQPLTNHIKSVTPDKPILISPLVYAPLTEAPTAAKLDQWKTICREVWSQTRIDIIAPQDGCGWESTMKETIVPWYRVMDEARKAAQPSRDAKGYGPAIAWNNPEMYSMNGVGTMTIKRFTDNMAAVDQYVSAHVSFSLHSLVYGKGGINRTNESFYKAYKYAKENGKLYMQTLPAPGGLSAAASNFDVTLSWDRVDGSAEGPVVGYEIWRRRADQDESTRIRVKEVEQAAEGGGTVTDAQVDGGYTYEYAVYAYDASGNRSSAPALTTVSVDGNGMTLNREFGGDIISEMSVSVSGEWNVKQKEGAPALMTDGLPKTALLFEKAEGETLGKYSIELHSDTARTLGFVRLYLQHNPYENVYLPEKIDVLVDGKPVTAVYPLKEYYDAAPGGVWIPIDLKAAVESKTVTLRITQKFALTGVSEIRLYTASATPSAGDGYREPQSLVEGQPVMITGYGTIQNFSPDEHFGGVKTNVLDTLKGTMSLSNLEYKGAYATRLLTRGTGKGPLLSWKDDDSRSEYLLVRNLGESFDLAVDLKTPSRIHGVETEWLLDRDATVFLPKKVEFYGMTTSGVEEKLGEAAEPSAALLDFNRAPAADNTHRVEIKGFKLAVDSETPYKKIIVRVFPQYPSNDHFVRSLNVY